ncbi:MAG: HNH endonuclease [Bdellovibrionales bacterium]|nr:HNH endonuclease [Bdellovibrionales bacterium]
MKLKHVADKALLNDMSFLAHQEREILAKVLWHLKEIDRRKLYCEVKCSSLFDYCVKNLKYSEGQASRRVSACRMLVDLPELAVSLEAGEVNLTQMNLVKQFFDQEDMKDKGDKNKVIGKIKGKTTRETERILNEIRTRNGPKKILLSLEEETVSKLKKVQGLKAHSCRDMDSLLIRMCAEVEKIWVPIGSQRKTKETRGLSRYVSVQSRADVWKKGQGKCQNCGSTYALEVDHIHPFAQGGKTKPENLQLLCRPCNQRRGYVMFGDKWRAKKPF